MIGIIQCDRHVGKSLRFSKLRTSKNNVLHRAAAQLPASLLTEHPAHCIGDIALTAAVRSDDARDSVVELKQNFIGK